MFTRHRVFPLRKALFILPNLFTLAAAFCGLYSMLLASNATRPWDFWAAGWLIGFAGILDGMDGRVARLTKTQSNFGRELDSLSDCLAFGVAPAWLVYHWGLHALGTWGLVASFTFTAGAMIRLARFNVITESDDDPRYFLGLPSPSAAAVPTLIVIVDSLYRTARHPVEPAVAVAMAALMVAIALLMVSNIRFASFKKLRPTAATFAVVAAVFGGITWVAVNTHAEVGLLAAFSGYVTLHLAAAVAALPRRVQSRLRHADQPPFGLLDDEDDETEVETPALG